MAAIGLAAGVLSGMGLGGGSVLVIALTLFMGVEQLTAQGINLMYFLPCAATALIVHLRSGSVDLRCALWAGGAGMLAAVGGSLLAAAIQPSFLRKIFAVLVLYMGGSEIVNRR